MMLRPAQELLTGCESSFPLLYEDPDVRINLHHGCGNACLSSQRSRGRNRIMSSKLA